MCIAVAKPEHVTISKEVLQNCFNANSDGAGFVVLIDGKLHMDKGFFKFDEFYEAFEPYMDYQALIHFRIKTHGVVDATNCHPFMVTNNLAFIHNGTIGGHGSKDFSDTWHFNEEVLKPLVNTFGKKALNQPFIKLLIEDYIGWSKLAFLDTKGNFIIFNEEKGVWDNDVWYSNTSYKPRQVYVPPKSNVIQYGSGNTYNYGAHAGVYQTTGGKFYVKKATGSDIYEGDLAFVNYPVGSLQRDDYVDVVSISGTGVIHVKDMFGKSHYGLTANALTVWDNNSSCGV